jgi:diguanylate cyclase (GGDEF)-like protein
MAAGHEVDGVPALAALRDAAAGRRDASGDRRDVQSLRRDEAARARDEAGDRRDGKARGRDRTALSRDDIARRRDAAADQRDAEASCRERARGGQDQAAAAARHRAASDRHQAAGDRLAGAADRGSAGKDRRISRSARGLASRERDAEAGARADGGRDRDLASGDRAQAARDLRGSLLDGLTGAYTRAAGLLELQREIDRSRRTGEPLVIAFLDVVGLKGTNDTSGHAAGDRVLVRVVQAVREELRQYDLVVRHGGDEFICALANTSCDEALSWRDRVDAALLPDRVTVGVAELQDQDDLQAVLARADADLYGQR